MKSSMVSTIKVASTTPMATYAPGGPNQRWIDSKNERSASSNSTRTMRSMARAKMVYGHSVNRTVDPFFSPRLYSSLGENIADNGGLKLSYLAYQQHKQRTSNTGNNLLLPGLSYRNDQLFFIAFAHVSQSVASVRCPSFLACAQSWCNLETRNAMHYSLVNDPHSPARFRVIGTLANSDEFAQAFA